MRQWPAMTFRNYIRKFALETKGGEFFCQICQSWINKQRWSHFKRFHKFRDNSGL